MLLLFAWVYFLSWLPVGVRLRRRDDLPGDGKGWFVTPTELKQTFITTQLIGMLSPTSDYTKLADKFKPGAR